PLLGLVHLLDHVDDGGTLLVADLRWSHKATPVGNGDLVAGVDDRRGVDSVDRLFAGDGEQTNFTGFHQVAELRGARGRRSDVAREQGRCQFTATGVGNVVDLLRLHSCCLTKLCHQDLVDTSHGAATPGNAPGILLEVGHELLEGFVFGV